MSRRLIMVDANAYDDACEKVLRDQERISRAAGDEERVTDLFTTISKETLAAVRLLLFEELKRY